MKNNRVFYGLYVFLAIFLSVLSQSGSAGAGSPEGASTRKPWLGVVIQEVNEKIARSKGLDDIKGVYVTEVSKGGPAAESGINEGDVILKLNGKEIDGAEEFISNIQALDIGNTVVLQVSKDGDVEDVGVILGLRPTEYAGDYGHTVLVPGRHAKDYAWKKSCGREGYGEGCRGGGCMEHGLCGGCGADEMRGMHMAGKYGKTFTDAVRSLRLTDDQKKKADALISDYRKNTIRSEAGIKVAEVELRELLQAEPANLEKIKAKTNDIGARKSELRFYRIKSLEEFKKTLTGEQRVKLKEAISSGGCDPERCMAGDGGRKDRHDACDEKD